MRVNDINPKVTFDWPAKCAAWWRSIVLQQKYSSFRTNFFLPALALCCANSSTLMPDLWFLLHCYWARTFLYSHPSVFFYSYVSVLMNSTCSWVRVHEVWSLAWATPLKLLWASFIHKFVTKEYKEDFHTTELQVLLSELNKFSSVSSHIRGQEKKIISLYLSAVRLSYIYEYNWTHSSLQKMMPRGA